MVTQNITDNFNIVDPAGNSTAVSYTIANIDKQDPTITLNGTNPTDTYIGDAFTDPSAVCTDNDSCTVTQTGTVDTNTLGTYTITYTATDPAGNNISITRTVNVISGSVPSITLIGSNPQIALV